MHLETSQASFWPVHFPELRHYPVLITQVGNDTVLKMTGLRAVWQQT